MLEFISLDTIKIIPLALVMIFILYATTTTNGKNPKEDRSAKNRAITLLIIVFTLPLINAFIAQDKAEENGQSFTRGNTLVCEVEDGNTYTVSKTEKWNKEKYYFKKNSLSLRADRCKRL